ncbi:MAG: 6-pyruvoyl-tetrahydropterin synthase-related protein, partial [Dehalococcoidia bacterium]
MTGATLMLNRLRLRMNARLGSIPAVPALLVGIVAVLLLSTFAIRELFGGGVILTGDTLHALRLRGMHECIADGQIPCRWVPNMGRGYGYPLFNYYPPLPYYTGELLRRIFGFSYIGTVDVLFITGLLSAGVSMFLLTRKVWGDLGGVVSAVAFVYAPYLALDTYMRGALVELWAIAVTPALLWAIYELITTERLRFVPIAALFVAFLLLSHNLTAIIMAPAIVLWTAVLLLTRGRRAWRPALLGAAALVWGLGLAAFFTLPVLTQGDDVQLDRLALTADGEALLYPRNFVTVNDLFLQRTDDYSLLLGAGEDTPIQIGWLHWALAGLALPAGLLYLRAKRWRPALAVLVFSAAFGIGVFMSVSKSRVIWDQFDTLRFLQFPWRYMGLVSLASAGLAGAWLGLLRNRALWLQLVVAAVLLAIFIGGGEAFFRPLYR